MTDGDFDTEDDRTWRESRGYKPEAEIDAVLTTKMRRRAQGCEIARLNKYTLRSERERRKGAVSSCRGKGRRETSSICTLLS
jgi:hypothetical protein